MIYDFKLRFMILDYGVFNSQFSIVNHRLEGDGVVHVDCGKNTQVIAGPDMIILHYTAGSSVMSSVRYLARPDVAASAHPVLPDNEPMT